MSVVMSSQRRATARNDALCQMMICATFHDGDHGRHVLCLSGERGELLILYIQHNQIETTVLGAYVLILV
jgi:hypothetical protein